MSATAAPAATAAGRNNLWLRWHRWRQRQLADSTEAVAIRAVGYRGQACRRREWGATAGTAAPVPVTVADGGRGGHAGDRVKRRRDWRLWRQRRRYVHRYHRGKGGRGGDAVGQALTLRQIGGSGGTGGSGTVSGGTGGDGGNGMVTPHQRPESRWAEAVGRVVLARTATVRPAHPERHNRGGPTLPRWIPPMLQYN